MMTATSPPPHAVVEAHLSRQAYSKETASLVALGASIKHEVESLNVLTIS